MIISTFIKWADAIPSGFSCLLFVAIVIGVAQLGLSIFNWSNKYTKLSANNEVTGIMFGTISLIYSLILAFAIVAVWEDYEDLKKTIQAEADRMNSIIIHSSNMPDSIQRPIHKALHDYCQYVKNNEWDMVNNIPNMPSSAIPCMRLMLLELEPQTDLQRYVFGVIDENLSQITDLRSNRLTHNHSQIPDIVWMILLWGSMILVAFSYFFKVNSEKLKRVYLSFLTGCLAMCLFLVWSLDHPYGKHSQVSKAPYTAIQNLLLKEDINCK